MNVSTALEKRFPFPDIETLRAADAYMQSVRKVAREKMKKGLRGRRNLDDNILSGFSHAFHESSILQATEVPENVLNDAFTRFEEIARRLHNRGLLASLPHHLRGAIYRRLGVEILRNAETYGATPEKAMPTTIYNGAFDLFSDAQYEDIQNFFTENGILQTGLIRYCAFHNPGDPAQALRNGIEKYNAIVKNEGGKYNDIHDFFTERGTLQTVLIRHCAFYNPGDPAQALRDGIGKYTAIVKNEGGEYNDIHDFFTERGTLQTGLIRHCAFYNPGDPAQALRDGIGKYTAIVKNEGGEYNDIHDFFTERGTLQTGLIRHCAFYNPGDPAQALRDGIGKYTAIVQNEGGEYNDIHDFFTENGTLQTGLIRHCAFYNPGDPAQALRDGIGKYTAIVQNEGGEYNDIHDFFTENGTLKTGLIRHCAFYYPGDPAQVLKQAIVNAKPLLAKYQQFISSSTLTRLDIAYALIMRPERSQQHLENLIVESVTGRAPAEDVARAR